MVMVQVLHVAACVHGLHRAPSLLKGDKPLSLLQHLTKPCDAKPKPLCAALFFATRMRPLELVLAGSGVHGLEGDGWPAARLGLASVLAHRGGAAGAAAPDHVRGGDGGEATQPNERQAHTLWLL